MLSVKNYTCEFYLVMLWYPFLLTICLIWNCLLFLQQVNKFHHLHEAFEWIKVRKAQSIAWLQKPKSMPRTALKSNFREDRNKEKQNQPNTHFYAYCLGSKFPFVFQAAAFIFSSSLLVSESHEDSNNFGIRACWTLTLYMDGVE